MGRKKSKRKPPRRRKPIMPLDKLFNCPFCNHEKSCEAKLDYLAGNAIIVCDICSEHYITIIHHLMEPIDVYNEWIDKCEEVNQ